MQPLKKNYVHLDDTMMQETTGNRWVPGIPLPLYVSEKIGLFKRLNIFECGCGYRTSRESEYQLHYRTEQLIEMNRIFTKTRAMQHGKAMFWRRAAFTFQHGTEREKQEFAREFDRNGWPEIVSQKRLDTCNEMLVEHWGPIHSRVMKTMTLEDAERLGKISDEEAVLEDEPLTGRKPYQHTNSKGVTYYLNMKEVSLRGGKMVPIRYFSKDFRPDTVQYELPPEFRVNENPRNGFLTIVRK